MLEHAEKASALYEDMTLVVGEEIHSLSVETIESTRAIGNRLKIDFSDTIYAFLGALHMAKIGVEMGDLESAESELRWMLENDADAALQPIVQVRLASIVAAQGRPEEALLLVYEHQDQDLSAHASSWYEMRGDIFYQLNDTAKARGVSNSNKCFIRASRQNAAGKIKILPLLSQSRLSMVRLLFCFCPPNRRLCMVN